MVPWRTSSPPVAADLADVIEGPHDTDLPEPVTITRPHHLLVGKTLALFGATALPGQVTSDPDFA
jgi:hypothetical protein